MQSNRHAGPACHRVVAEFERSSLVFPLPIEATLEDLAALLAALGPPRGGMPISVAVTIGT